MTFFGGAQSVELFFRLALGSNNTEWSVRATNIVSGLGYRAWVVEERKERNIETHSFIYSSNSLNKWVSNAFLLRVFSL